MPKGVYLRKPVSKEHRLNNSISHIGVNTWSKGKPWSRVRVLAQKIITRKPISKKCGEYNPEWHKIRKTAYERDLWICRECGRKCHGNNTKDKIQCHHIDYDKDNNNLGNLITLCASCHMKTNFNRQNWIDYYKLKVEN